MYIKINLIKNQMYCYRSGLIISFITSRISASRLRVDRRRMQRRDNELIFRARKLT